MDQVHFAEPYAEERIDEPIHFGEKMEPVALLIDEGTSGAGEELAMGFEGRSRTTYIGERTAGLTDGGNAWNLPDGAVLTITTGLSFDRRGRGYPEGIQPEILVADPASVTTPTEDPAVIKAEQWLVTQMR